MIRRIHGARASPQMARGMTEPWLPAIWCTCSRDVFQHRILTHDLAPLLVLGRIVSQLIDGPPKAPPSSDWRSAAASVSAHTFDDAQLSCGIRPLTAATRVRIPQGTPIISTDYGCFLACVVLSNGDLGNCIRRKPFRSSGPVPPQSAFNRRDGSALSSGNAPPAPPKARGSRCVVAAASRAFRAPAEWLSARQMLSRYRGIGRRPEARHRLWPSEFS
jgi:hypothetical protein